MQGGGPCHLETDCCHDLDLVWTEVDSGTCSCCSSSGCAAAEPAVGWHLSAGRLPSESHAERGDHSVQQFHWRHKNSVLETERSRTTRVNRVASNSCNLREIEAKLVPVNRNRPTVLDAKKMRFGREIATVGGAFRTCGCSSRQRFWAHWRHHDRKTLTRTPSWQSPNFLWGQNVVCEQRFHWASDSCKDRVSRHVSKVENFIEFPLKKIPEIGKRTQGMWWFLIKVNSF